MNYHKVSYLVAVRGFRYQTFLWCDYITEIAQQIILYDCGLGLLQR